MGSRGGTRQQVARTNQRDYRAATSHLVTALGIDSASYERFVAWCLSEQLASELARAVGDDPDHRDVPLWERPDGLKRFRRILRAYTGRSWSQHDCDALFARVKAAATDHVRRPVSPGDLLRLLWNAPHECVQCGRRPPEVILHVDHRFPASKGGSSGFENLQFLCAEHNLRKSNKLEEGELWLDSV